MNKTPCHERNTTPRTTTRHAGHERQPSTHPQPCEPLLTGWIVGANSHVTTQRERQGRAEEGRSGGVKDNEHHHHHHHHHPQPNDTQGRAEQSQGRGGQHEQRGGEARTKGRGGTNKCRTTNTTQQMPTQHPLPASTNNREGRAGQGGMNKRHATHDDPAPAPSPASHCSQGGSRVLMAMSPSSMHERRGGQCKGNTLRSPTTTYDIHEHVRTSTNASEPLRTTS
jgi:hypothetical protein